MLSFFITSTRQNPVYEQFTEFYTLHITRRKLPFVAHHEEDLPVISGDDITGDAVDMPCPLVIE